MLKLLLITGSLLIGFVSTVEAKHYNSLRLNCSISANEVSISPKSSPSGRLQRTDLPVRFDYVLDRVIYVSNGAGSTTRSIDFDAPSALYPQPHWQSKLPNWSPWRVIVGLKHGEVIAEVLLNRSQILDMLTVMGSETSGHFVHDNPDVEFDFTMYSDPTLSLANEPWRRLTGDSVNARFRMAGRVGNTLLETCHQVSPLGDFYDSASPYTGISYHLCALCRTEFLEGTSPKYAPRPWAP